MANVSATPVAGWSITPTSRDLPTLEWDFPAPMGPRTVLGEFTMADVVTVPSHLSIPEVRTYMTTDAAKDLAAPDTPAPTAVDERGRSAQTFIVDVIVRSGDTQRRVAASGQDIYAISAPLAVEAVHRILGGQTRTSGVASAGEIFDAPDFLRALSAHIRSNRSRSLARHVRPMGAQGNGGSRRAKAPTSPEGGHCRDRWPQAQPGR